MRSPPTRAFSLHFALFLDPHMGYDINPTLYDWKQGNSKVFGEWIGDIRPAFFYIFFKRETIQKPADQGRNEDLH